MRHILRQSGALVAINCGKVLCGGCRYLIGQDFDWPEQSYTCGIFDIDPLRIGQESGEPERCSPCRAQEREA
jgi:hypothetical protein